MRYRKPHRFKKKRLVFKDRFFWVGTLIFVFLVFAIYFLFFSDFFQIEKIIVRGNKKVPEKEITEIVEEGFKSKKTFFLAENILLVNLNEIKENILNSLPQVAEVKMNRKLPHTLIFSILERKGVAEFCKDYELFTKDESKSTYQRCFLLDKEGIFFEENFKESLLLAQIKNPNLRDELELGQKIIEPDLLSGILDIFSALETLNIPTKNILLISEERIDVKTSEGWEIYFNPEEDLDWQLTKLRAVLEKDIPSEKRRDLEYIELRFGNLAPFKYKNLP